MSRVSLVLQAVTIRRGQPSDDAVETTNLLQVRVQRTQASLIFDDQSREENLHNSESRCPVSTHSEIVPMNEDTDVIRRVRVDARRECTLLEIIRHKDVTDEEFKLWLASRVPHKFLFNSAQ